MTSIKVRDWQIVEQIPEDGGREPRFSVVIADPALSARPVVMNLPYTGITDTTVSPETHDLYLQSELPLPKDKKTLKDSLFFRKKVLSEDGGAPGNTPFPNTVVGAVFANPVGERRKAIIDDASGVSLTVAETTTAMGRPGQEMLVGQNGVTMLSGSPRILSLPEEDLVLFKQKGIGQLAPQCFVPPFCFPEYMPNFEFVSQVAGVVSIVKEIARLTRTIR